MLDRWLNLPAHKYLNTFSAFVLIVGLPLSKVLMSIGTMLLVLNFLLEFDLKKYKQYIKSQPLLIFVGLIVAFHFLGLLWSDDINYGLDDIRKKIPFFILPFVLVANPVERKHFDLLFFGFITTILITSIINVTHFYFYSSSLDFRDLSLFGSHIRYGLILVFGLVWTIFKLYKIQNLWLKFLLGGVIVWLVYYLFIAQVLSTYLVVLLLILVFIAKFFLAFGSRKVKVFNLIIFTLLIFMGSFFTYRYFTNFSKTESVDIYSLPTHSADGNLYMHYNSNQLENGHYVMHFIAEVEMKMAWEQISDYDYNGLDEKGQPLKGTLIRFLTSKGERKDRLGVESLSDFEIRAIEQGITSVVLLDSFWKTRLESMKMQYWSYKNGMNPEGNSILQRLEHWRAAIHIISNNYLFGVGTGDVQNAFNEAYIAIETNMDEAYWLRAHNQFLSFWVAFGIFGFIIFLAFCLYLLLFSYRSNDVLFLAFVIICMASFIPEDTLETQQGVTFVAFFLGLFLSKDFKEIPKN